MSMPITIRDMKDEIIEEVLPEKLQTHLPQKTPQGNPIKELLLL